MKIEGKSTGELWADLDLAIAEVAKLEPIFPPGTTACYHGLTIGWIAEGIVRGLAGPPIPLLVVKMPDGSDQLWDHKDNSVVPLYQVPFVERPIPIEPPVDQHRVVWLGGSSIRGGDGAVLIGAEAANLVGRSLGVESVNLAAPALDTGHIAGLLPQVLALHLL